MAVIAWSALTFLGILLDRESITWGSRTQVPRDFNGAEGALNGVIASNPISHFRVLADSTRNTIQIFLHDLCSDPQV